MSQRITIEIKDKIATCLTQLPIVCGNADYVIDFVFDEEWNTHNIKTALFVVNGKVTPRVFEGTVCPVPVIQNALMACVGVFAGAIDDGTLSTSTSALVKCTPCVTDGDNVPLPPPTDVYNQIIDLLNKYIAGGSGEVDVRTLQTKVDNALQTKSKEVVGAINELNEIAKRADENSQNGTIALETANTANESATMAKETAERAEEKVDALDEIASESLKLASQSFDLVREASENADFAKERMVEKTEQANQLYGTDENGEPTLYPTDSVGTQVKVDGQKVKEFNADEKFDKAGGVIGGDVSVQGNLSVSGTTTTKDTETLQVKDNVIVANADGVELVDDSGFAIKTSTTSAYGIMYSPLGDGVKIGLGHFEDGKFVYDEGQAQFLATRADTLTDGNLPKWDNKKKQFVDSGAKIGDYVKFTDIASTANAGVVKINNAFGIRINNAGELILDSSNDSEIKHQSAVNTPIRPNQLPQAVKSGLVKHENVTLTDEEQRVACEWLGAHHYSYPFEVDNYGFGGLYDGWITLLDYNTGCDISISPTGIEWNNEDRGELFLYPTASGTLATEEYVDNEILGVQGYVDDEIAKAHALLNKTKLYVHTITIPDESVLVGTTTLTIITNDSTPYTSLTLTSEIINGAFYKVLNRGSIGATPLIVAGGGLGKIKLYYFYAGAITSKELDLTNATFSCEEF